MALVSNQFMLPGVYSERCGGGGSVFMRCVGTSQVAQLLRTISRRSDPESNSASTASAAGDGSLFIRQGGSQGQLWSGQAPPAPTCQRRSSRLT